MLRQSQAIILLVCSALGTGCGSDTALGPDGTSLEQTGFSVRVTPNEAVLFVAGPGNALQLTVEAFDERGALIPGPYSTAYSSSAPTIAGVSGSGVVTAVSYGTAMITTTVTVGRVTRTALAAVTVAVPPMGSWRIAGVYDLTAQITGFDPAWGDLTGHQYTAALVFSPGFDTPGEVGTFTDMRILDADGESLYPAWSGPITLSLPVISGLFVLELGTNFTAVVTYVAEPDESAVASPLIEGRFGVGGHIGGTFVARLRGSPLGGS